MMRGWFIALFVFSSSLFSENSAEHVTVAGSDSAQTNIGYPAAHVRGPFSNQHMFIPAIVLVSASFAICLFFDLAVLICRYQSIKRGRKREMENMEIFGAYAKRLQTSMANSETGSNYGHGDGPAAQESSPNGDSALPDASGSK